MIPITPPAPRPIHPSSMLAPLLIHLVVPAAGLVWYLRLRKRMHSSGVPDAPDRRLFLVFFHYGGWLLVLLTARSSQESAAATAGLMYLLLFAPWLMAGVAVRTFSRRSFSAYHRATFWAACLYVAAMCVLVPAVWWAPRQWTMNQYTEPHSLRHAVPAWMEIAERP